MEQNSENRGCFRNASWFIMKVVTRGSPGKQGEDSDDVTLVPDAEFRL